VCICTHDRAGYVGDCLEGLAGQTVARDRFNILLIDSASSPGAAAELTRLADRHGARLIRLTQPGVSLARNAGAWAARTGYIAYIDDDAIPAPDWIASILEALAQPGRRPAVIGGRILPKWEAPLPHWWPASLRGVLSIIEHEGAGEYRSPEVPPGLEPYAANMVVHVLSLLAIGGFKGAVGRHGKSLLSDEEVQLAWALQDAGYPARYDSRITVYHQIQARRLAPT
jgi:glucosyl-dolichyl phosphate glucuronosyltransferase